MTWRELWQNAVANLRALFGGLADTPAPPPAPSDESAPEADAPPAFPTVWDDPSPVLPSQRVELDSSPERVDAPAHVAPDQTPLAEAKRERVEVDAPAPLPAALSAPEATHEEIGDGVEEAAAHVQDVEGAPLPALDPAGETPMDAPMDTPGAKPSLSMVLESVLFVAGESVTPAQLARSLQVSEAEILAELDTLAEHYRSSGRGLRLQLLNGKVQLVTAPSVATYVEAFLNLDATSRLSGPALETLAVVAYRQPVTRAQVEAIRGVDCAGVLRTLVQRGLIGEVGRLESVGRPILYGVTEMFMQHFGLADLKDLPPLEENEADRLWAASLLAESDTEPDTDPGTGTPSSHESLTG